MQTENIAPIDFERLPNEGWSWLFNAKKEHYFRGGRALCGRWMILGLGSCIKTAPSEADRCVACYRKRDRELLRESAV